MGGGSSKTKNLNEPDKVQKSLSTSESFILSFSNSYTQFT